jgi:all-trans-8'-apo-beta-carotenal 15,15'-oxygenase
MCVRASMRACACLTEAKQSCGCVRCANAGSGGTNRPTVLRVDVDAHFSFHYANAFEDEASGEIVVDTVRAPSIQLGSGLMRKDADGKAQPIWETIDFERDVPRSTLWRYRIKTRSVGGKLYQAQLSSSEPISDRYLDFPVVNRINSGLPYRYAWAATGSSASQVSPVQGLVKIDTQAPDLQASPSTLIRKSQALDLRS